MRALLGVTGSIAAYKAADLAHTLCKRGAEVTVIMTASACRLVSPITFQTLTRRRVYTELFDPLVYEDVRHISLAQWADIALVAPATANVIGKLAHGIADDMLTTVLTALGGKPLLICPAMNTAMLDNPIVQDNIARLARFGCRFAEPREALLACGDTGRGALADTGAIADAAFALWAGRCGEAAGKGGAAEGKKEPGAGDAP